MSHITSEQKIKQCRISLCATIFVLYKGKLKLGVEATLKTNERSTFDWCDDAQLINIVS